MKMLKSPVIAASVTLSLTACFEDILQMLFPTEKHQSLPKAPLAANFPAMS
ncbi:hypothetical protein [uncultured Fibrobacter sp.]|uniref:hypothetical protein n=1 Tax=uncultured Fibrobacter sp. TaxID=261512 RepID=UPI0025F344FE|nr:hypothetical protein [uncultured Fibrobacter sp.]